MKEERILNVLGKVDEKYIKEADPEVKAKRKAPVWTKWVAMAACLALLVVSVPYIANIVTLKGGPGQDDPMRPLNAIEYNGAYYEVIDMSDVDLLDSYNLPHEITPDMVGTSLGTGLDDAGKASKEMFYVYEPYAHISTITGNLSQERVQRAVYVVQSDNEYSFALFCNFISFDTNTHTESKEMFAVYGIDEAQDIASVVLGRKKLSDPAEIESVFNNLLHSQSIGNDDYQSIVFGNMSEEKKQALSIELADSMVSIQIETVDGLIINNIHYYPTINYVGWALSYYQLGEALE